LANDASDRDIEERPMTKSERHRGETNDASKIRRGETTDASKIHRGDANVV